jgi:hypothetical protein
MAKDKFIPLRKCTIVSRGEIVPHQVIQTGCKTTELYSVQEQGTCCKLPTNQSSLKKFIKQGSNIYGKI